MSDEDRKLLFRAGRLGPPVLLVHGHRGGRAASEFKTPEAARSAAWAGVEPAIYQREADGTWTELALSTKLRRVPA